MAKTTRSKTQKKTKSNVVKNLAPKTAKSRMVKGGMMRTITYTPTGSTKFTR